MKIPTCIIYLRLKREPLWFSHLLLFSHRKENLPFDRRGNYLADSGSSLRSQLSSSFVSPVNATASLSVLCAASVSPVAQRFSGTSRFRRACDWKHPCTWTCRHSSLGSFSTVVISARDLFLLSLDEDFQFEVQRSVYNVNVCVCVCIKFCIVLMQMQRMGHTHSLRLHHHEHNVKVDIDANVDANINVTSEQSLIWRI